jgi:hypothetical protein
MVGFFLVYAPTSIVVPLQLPGHSQHVYANERRTMPESQPVSGDSVSAFPCRSAASCARGTDSRLARWVAKSHGVGGDRYPQIKYRSWQPASRLCSVLARLPVAHSLTDSGLALIEFWSSSGRGLQKPQHDGASATGGCRQGHVEVCLRVTSLRDGADALRYALQTPLQQPD